MASLVIGNQQPYAMDPDGPLVRVVTDGLAAARTQGMDAVLRPMEAFWHVRFPSKTRAAWLDNDALAVDAAWRAALAQGAIARDLASWRTPCLIFAGTQDPDFFDQAQRAAVEIPTARFIALDDLDHIGAHVTKDERVIDAARSMLRPQRLITADGDPFSRSKIWGWITLAWGVHCAPDLWRIDWRRRRR